MKNNQLNLICLIASLFLSGPLSVAIAAQPQLPGLNPLPPPPPLLEANVDRADLLPSSLPQLSSDAHTQDADPRQEITITQQSEQTVEEYRVGGRLYMIKITPKTGAPHYLVDDLSDGRFSYSQNIDPSFRSPRWVIRKF